MSSSLRYYAAAIQLDLPNPKHRDEIGARVKHLLDLVEYAVVGYRPFHDVRLVVFPDEGHWILKGENSRLHMQEVLGWLKKYL